MPDEPIRWIRPETIHLTLRFLGETSDTRLESILRSAEAGARAWVPFDLRLRGAGCFPDDRKPRIVWIGGADSLGSLPAIARSLEELARRSGYAAETRAFTPHLTIGRVKGPLSAAGGERLRDLLRDSADADFGSVHVDSLDLMRSDLKPSGPVYTRLAALALGAAATGPS